MKSLSKTLNQSQRIQLRKPANKTSKNKYLMKKS